MEKQVIRDLIQLYLAKKASPEEQERLLHFLQHNEALVVAIMNEMQEQSEDGRAAIDLDRMQHSLQKVLSADKPDLAPVVTLQPATRSKRWLAAASIILLIGIGIGVYTWMKPSKQLPPIAKATIPNDILAPTNSRAMITLADGSRVFLDSLNNGAVATQGNVQLVKLANGQIAYNPTSTITDHQSPITYNTLTNPRGSKVIDMKLSDGTHVWLNAGSSITYPVAFAGDERKVTLSGEGYFEVAHDASKPFHVGVGEMDVKVLGTHFNVNAYPDEGEIKTTLLEGSVQVREGKSEIVLNPGQQAALQTSSHRLQRSDNVNVEEVMAWKEG
ncbi:MAG: FecR domain-containing protein, partial [Bacteroidetes bacterium]|nr:FecR domain-containing protein [Bacteroidota bacterium]